MSSSGLLSYELNNNPIILNLVTNSYKPLLRTLLRNAGKKTNASEKRKKASLIGGLDVSAFFGKRYVEGTDGVERDADEASYANEAGDATTEPETPTSSSDAPPGVYDLILLVPHSPTTTQLTNPLTLKTLYSYIAFFSPEDNKILSLNGIRMVVEDNRLLILDSEIPKTFDSLSREKQMEFQKDPAATFRNESKWDPSKPKKNILILREAWVGWSEEKKEFFIVSQRGTTAGGEWVSSSPTSGEVEEKFRLFLISNPVVDISEEELKASSSTDSKLNDLILAHNNSVSSFNDELDRAPSSTPNSTSTKTSESMQQVRQSNGPYTFKDFVDKMRHKNSSSLVKSLKKFIADVNSRPHSDTLPRRVRKFLLVIMKELERHPQWKDATDLEMENAREGVEKYVMTKIFNRCFSSIEDMKVDQELSMRMSCFQALPPSALDIPAEIVAHEQWEDAKEALIKMNSFKTPRDKMICISHCCRILFNILQRVNPEELAGADVFLPVLLYLVLQANPPCLHSNIKYINDYRNPDKMVSEAGYFLTNIQGAESFWLNCDASQLNITEEEFDRLLGRSKTEYTTQGDSFMGLDSSVLNAIDNMTPPDKDPAALAEVDTTLTVENVESTLSPHPIVSEIRNSTHNDDHDSLGKLSEVSTEDDAAIEAPTVKITIPLDKQQIITVHDAEDGKKSYFFPRFRRGSGVNSTASEDTKTTQSQGSVSSENDRSTQDNRLRKEISRVLDSDAAATFVGRGFSSLSISDLSTIFENYRRIRQQLQNLIDEQ